MKLTTPGKRALRIAALSVASVLVTAIFANLVKSHHSCSSQDKHAKWEYIDCEDGTDLLRLETPGGWVVEGADGYLIYVPDPSKSWLSGGTDGL